MARPGIEPRIEIDLRDMLSESTGLLSNNRYTYSGIKRFTTLNIILALFKKTLSSNANMFNVDLALSKSVYSSCNIRRQARF